MNFLTPNYKHSFPLSFTKCKTGNRSLNYDIINKIPEKREILKHREKIHKGYIFTVKKPFFPGLQAYEPLPKKFVNFMEQMKSIK